VNRQLTPHAAPFAAIENPLRYHLEQRVRSAEVNEIVGAIGGDKITATLDEQRSIVAKERTEPDFVPDVMHGVRFGRKH
jgi:hypothetical protein